MALITVTSKNIEKSVLISPRGLMQVDGDNYVLAPKERAKSKRSANVRILARIFQFTSWILLAVLSLSAVMLVTNVAQARVVLTDSMSPEIMPGDVVIAVGTNWKNPKVGDVVIYTGKKFDGTPVASFTHRVIGGDQTSGFVVKGDKNESPDVQKPVLNEIEAVMLFTIPSLGLLLTPQSLTLLLFTFFGLWLIFDAFRMGRR